MKKYDVVELARQILRMDHRIREQERTITELMSYRDKYFELLDAYIKHGEKMMGGIMDLVMKPGVSEALAAASKVEVDRD